MIDVPPGHLYLGERIAESNRERNGEAILLDSADLTTHGVIVGMTGSGKTGLGVVLLEEALLQGIPTLIIDPKGDLGNLLLTFPALRPEDFAPWVEGADPADTASQWKQGLAEWGIEPTRITALRESAEFTIYTPGSTSGVPLNIVGGLRRPPEGTDLETIRSEVEGFVSGLLNLVGIKADPLASKEHILLSNLVETAWTAGRDLDLADLVNQVDDPPLRKLGVYELEEFYPAKERAKLAMTLNGLLASPSFAAWTQGPDLDPDTLLRSADGTRPACAIISLSHLADEERQFVVSLTLGRLITWMRGQPGTNQLRTLVYFDEVMGFVPPIAAPPAKKPILTLFKQARAFGVGIVLATQNPVDVDYKGLANAGTWMIGRLQTEQDKARLLDGMSSAAGGVDVRKVSDTIASLEKRQFVLREAGEEAPGLFTTRWAMAYLRGPLTREQIASLMAGRWQPPSAGPAAAAPTQPAPPPAEASAAAPPAAAAAARAEAPVPATPLDGETVPVAPAVAEGVPVRWLDPAAPWAPQIGAVPTGTRFAPALVARVALLYDEDRLGLHHSEDWEAVLFPLTPDPDPAAATSVDHDDRDLRSESPAGATYLLTDAKLNTKSFFAKAEKGLVDHLFRHRTQQVLRNTKLKLVGRVGETSDGFAARCHAAATEGADEAQVALQRKYESRIARARDALDTASRRYEEASAAAQSRQADDLAAGAGVLLDAVLRGRRGARSVARSLGKVLSGGGMGPGGPTRNESARDAVVNRQDALANLEADLAAELTAIDQEWNDKAGAVETVEVPLEKSDIRVTQLALVWVPVS